jgi:Flp pilus assembly protein CpaB
MNPLNSLLPRRGQPAPGGPAQAAPSVAPRSPSPGVALGVRARRMVRPAPLLGLVLILVAVVGYWSVYSTSTQRTPVLVATRSLPAGAVLRTGDLRIGELAGDSHVMGSIAKETAMSQVLGRRLATPVTAGAPLPTDAIARAAAHASAMTIALDSAHALGGALQPGDRVSVLATFGAGNTGAHTRVIARALQVLSVQTASSMQSNGGQVSVTLALTDPAVASTLALANDDAKIMLLLDGSRDRAAAIPPATEDAQP